MQTLIQKAGPYDVIQHPCRQYGPVNMTSPRSGVLHTTEGRNYPLGEFTEHWSPKIIARS